MLESIAEAILLNIISGLPFLAGWSLVIFVTTRWVNLTLLKIFFINDSSNSKSNTSALIRLVKGLVLFNIKVAAAL